MFTLFGTLKSTLSTGRTSAQEQGEALRALVVRDCAVVRTRVAQYVAVTFRAPRLLLSQLTHNLT